MRFIQFFSGLIYGLIIYGLINIEKSWFE